MAFERFDPRTQPVRPSVTIAGPWRTSVSYDVQDMQKGVKKRRKDKRVTEPLNRAKRLQRLAHERNFGQLEGATWGHGSAGRG